MLAYEEGDAEDQSKTIPAAHSLAARCWKGASPKYSHLLQDPDIKRWYDNVRRGSKITADVYLRRVGSLCNAWGMRSPMELLERARNGDERWAYNFLVNIVTRMESEGKAGSYAKSSLKGVKSWFLHNGIEIKGKVRIRGAEDTPTLRDKRTLSNSELALFYSSAPAQTRCAAALIAESGLRPESVGNYGGTDGARAGDIPEMKIERNGSDPSITFARIPALLIVRKELSKARHQYFTFLTAESCRYVAEYLTQRMKAGEVLDGSSPLITPRYDKPRKNAFVRTSLLGHLVRKRLRACRINARPYDLRSTFDTQLMLAESRGLIMRDYRVFFMGHKGDIEHRYTTNKLTLQPDVIEDMRSAFARAQKYLQVDSSVSEEDDLATQIKKQILLTVGYKQDEVAKLNLAEMTDEEVQNLIKQKLFAVMMNNGQRQRVATPDEVEKAIAEGWEWMGNLPNGKAVLRLPS